MKERELIIDNKILSTEIKHPDEAKRNKKWIVDLFLNDIENSKLIYEAKKGQKVYEISIDGERFYFSFDTSDSGGAKNRRKISIPFKTLDFKKHIENGENIFVVNLFRPLDKMGNPDLNNRIWVIINPLEIYKSEVIDKTWNDSSRWVSVKELFDCLNDKTETININKKGTVLFAKNNNIKKLLLNNNLKSRYYLMNEINKNAKEFLNSKTESNLNNLRSSFRMLLLEENINNMIDSKIKNNSLLIASHIFAVQDIRKDKTLSLEEKEKMISDPKNGLLIPVGLDKLFDKYFITFDDEWNIMLSEDVTKEEVVEMCGREIEGPWITGKDKETLFYLKKHRETAFSKRNFIIN